jgi:hypothetical protein
VLPSLKSTHVTVPKLIGPTCVDCWATMSNQKKVQEYLARANEAEALAGRFAPGSFYETSWLAIAQGYRALAQVEQPSETPSV